MYNSRDVNSSAKRGPISFSSTLLDEIYRSIDDGSARSPRAEKWIDKKKSVGGLSMSLPLHLAADTKKLHSDDALFFSSGSNSSDSNSSLFSDHDSISLPAAKTRSSCFLPPKPKPIRTKTTLAKTEQEHEDENDVVSKSTSATKTRALKMYAHLKKMKQPISPGMKLTTFINSILHNSKSKRGSATAASDDRSKKPTTKCSSATSFARSKNLHLNQQTTPYCKSVKTEPERPRTLNSKRRDEIRLNSSIRKPVDVDDDEGSCSDSSDCSEDLFEIDHLKLRFTSDDGELPVYETTASKTTISTSRLSSTCNQNRTFIKGKRC